jgi:hypothetical protein
MRGMLREVEQILHPEHLAGKETPLQRSQWVMWVVLLQMRMTGVPD